MKVSDCVSLIGLLATLAAPRLSYVVAQSASDTPVGGNDSQFITGHPFTAIKYARRMKVLRDGTLQFIRNERYPTRIARDADGRLMMQVVIHSDVWPECDRSYMLVPPPCPFLFDFAIDPVAHSVSHWQEGEKAGRAATTFPVTKASLDEAAQETSVLPDLTPESSQEYDEVETSDLGTKAIEGVSVHETKWTLRRVINRGGQPENLTRIHEVWTSDEMRLVVRVVDGDPNGEEQVWGLEKISLTPDGRIFHPPDGYGTHHIHSKSDFLAADDFEYLKSWFTQ